MIVVTLAVALSVAGACGFAYVLVDIWLKFMESKLTEK